MTNDIKSNDWHFVTIECSGDPTHCIIKIDGEFIKTKDMPKDFSITEYDLQ